MGGAVGGMQIIGELPQHRRIAINRPHWLAVDIGERRQPVIRTENIRRAIDKVEMLLIGHRQTDSKWPRESLGSFQVCRFYERDKFPYRLTAKPSARKASIAALVARQ